MSEKLSPFTVEYKQYLGHKRKIMGKFGIYGLFPRGGTTVKQFLFYRVSKKIEKNAVFLKGQCHLGKILDML